MTDLPHPLARLVETVNGGDTAGFLALLDTDSVVDDWGSVYSGLAEIEKWSNRELIGAKGIMTVRSVEQTASGIDLIADWKSNFYTGPGRFSFALRNDKIAHWRIRGV
jgi:hypothetical protein